MRISKKHENYGIFMKDEELNDFKRYLSIAIEDLINVRPNNPKKYFALALCRSLPSDDSLQKEFPELADDFPKETASKISIVENADGPLRVVDVREVAVFFSKKFNLFEDFFVLKLAVVSAAKVKHPAFYFPRESMA